MKLRVLHYATGRDDKVIATYKDVTFINRHVGWYVDAKDERHENRDNIAIVERVDGICFVAEFLSRNAAFDKEHLAAVATEALNLRAAMQERIASRQWIPLPYVAAYEVLGWDARPLKEHRAYMLELRRAASREQKLAQAEQATQKQQTELQQAERTFRNGEFIAAEHFIGLCGKYGIKIHPRTLGTLRKRIARVSSTHIQCKNSYARTPSADGCSGLIDRLMKKLR